MNRNTEFLTHVRRIIRLHDRMLKPICEKYGLTLMEASVVSFLYNNPGKDTAADIVELRMQSKGNVSQAVEGLMQKGLLHREQDAEDRRKIHLFLCPGASPITGELEAVRKNFEAKIFAGFSEEDRRQFARLSDRFIENTKSAMRAGDDENAREGERE